MPVPGVDRCAPKAHNARMQATGEAMMTWVENDKAGLVGYAADGSVPLFTVSWTTAIDEIGHGATMVIKSSLPGFEHQVWRAGTFEDAKALSERILDGWRQRVFGQA
jgi:hypothetical protein